MLSDIFSNFGPDSIVGSGQFRNLNIILGFFKLFGSRRIKPAMNLEFEKRHSRYIGRIYLGH